MSYRTCNDVLTNPEAITFFELNKFWAFKGIPNDFCYACDDRNRMYQIGINATDGGAPEDPPKGMKIVGGMIVSEKILSPGDTWEALAGDLEATFGFSGTPQEIVAQGVNHKVVHVLREQRDVHREGSATFGEWRPLK